ncbi:hypothetical protein [Bacillus sp. EB01]|uniref:hypothetical protein n=1 Tax=Bacillus sp. EB01 TaxID=1347086 RepID=UPI0005C6AD72|nr:hypothetical protein [Bacillus sp. EB01]
MGADKDFIVLITKAKNEIEKHDYANDFVLTAMLEQLDRLKDFVETNSLNKNITTLGVVRYTIEYEVPGEIGAVVNEIDRYYNNVYKRS